MIYSLKSGCNEIMKMIQASSENLQGRALSETESGDSEEDDMRKSSILRAKVILSYTHKPKHGAKSYTQNIDCLICERGSLFQDVNTASGARNKFLAICKVATINNFI